MSFDSAIGLNQIDASMDQIEIQHRQILLSLDSIYTALVYGSQIETECANLVFILYDKLKHYWYNIPIPKIKKVPTNISVKVNDEEYNIDFFIEKECADFD